MSSVFLFSSGPSLGDLLSLYLLALNILSFSLMGIDKRRARQNRWRIPERTLFLSALLGGSPGAILGMYLFHHKTKHWYFKWGLPAILAVQLLLLWRLAP